jgi:hypothetical protein
MTQAGEFVREEIEHVCSGKHGAVDDLSEGSMSGHQPAATSQGLRHWLRYHRDICARRWRRESHLQLSPVSWLLCDSYADGQPQRA